MDSLQAQVLHIFMQEGADLLEQLDATLLELEDEPEAVGHLDTFMRIAHTLKGSAGTVGLGPFSALAHAIEDVVDGMRRSTMYASPHVFDQLSGAIDALIRYLSGLPQGVGEDAELLVCIKELQALRPNPENAEKSAQGSTRGGGFPLGEYDNVRMLVAKKRGQSVYRIDLSILPSEPDAVAYAESLIKTIRKRCNVIASNPPAPEMQRVNETRSLSLIAASEKTDAELRSLLHDDGIKTKKVALFEEQKPLAQVATEPPVLATRETGMRVEMHVLDDLLRMVGELVLNRTALGQVAADISRVLEDADLATRIHEAAASLEHIAADLQTSIMRARLVPIARLFRSMKRCVRDTSRLLDRAVRPITHGEQTLVDQGLLSTLRAPFLELLQVLVAGSAPAGIDVQTTLSVRARREGDRVYVTVDSDAAKASPRDIAPIVEEAQAARGDLHAADGQLGTAYTLAFPATQVILPTIVAQVGPELYAFPLEKVQETFLLTNVQTIAARRTSILRGYPLSLVYLDEILDVPNATRAQHFVVVVKQDGGRVGVVVNHVLGKRVTVRKPLGRRFSRIKSFDGATILADGHIALVLDLAHLIEQANAQDAVSASFSEAVAS